jgi:hypothetical protein
VRPAGSLEAGMTPGGDKKINRPPSRSRAKWWLVLIAGLPIIALPTLLQGYLGDFNAKAAATAFVLVWAIGYVVSQWTGRS